MPISGPGGSRFNGGTITRALTVNKALAANASDKPLDLLDPNNTDAEISVDRTVDGSGNEDVRLGLAAALDGVSRLALNDDNLDGSITLQSSGDSQMVARSTAASSSAVLSMGTGVGFGSRFLRDGYFVTKLHAAPADADLAAGDCALWFDQTNGAATLMVKAKQADGTVRTGSLALT